MTSRAYTIAAATAILLAVGIIARIRGRRAGRAWTIRDAPRLAGGVLLGFSGVAASMLLAPRGVPPRLWEPALLLAFIGLGRLGPLRGGDFWTGCAAGLAAGALLGPLALPDDPVLAGGAEPRLGAEVEVEWSLDGARVLIVDPLDPPREFVNGRRTDLSIAGWPALAERSAAACPDGADEERAALEAFLAGNLDQAAARGRLALVICDDPPLARAVVGEVLLRKAVVALRTGRTRRAAEDLDEAEPLLDDPGARARLERARARLELMPSSRIPQSIRSSAPPDLPGLAPTGPVGVE